MTDGAMLEKVLYQDQYIYLYIDLGGTVRCGEGKTEETGAERR